MKKNVVLVMLVLAMAVVPLFAEPTFSGSFSYGLNYDFGEKDVWEGLANKGKIDFKAELSDFTSLTASVGGNQGEEVYVNSLVLSQDLTGALGFDGPLAFSYKLGKCNFEVHDYSFIKHPDAKVGTKVSDKMEEYDLEIEEDGETKTVVGKRPVMRGKKVRGNISNMVGFVATVGIMDTLNVDIALYPETYLNEKKDDEEFAVNLSGTFGKVKASAYYTISQEFTQVHKFGWCQDDYGDFVGFNASVQVLEPLFISAFFERDMEDETSTVALSGKYNIGDLSVRLGADVNRIGLEYLDDDKKVEWNVKDCLDVDADLIYKKGGLSSHVRLRGSMDDFATKSYSFCRLAYGIDELTFYGQTWLWGFKDLKMGENVDYEIGMKYNLEKVTVNVGYVDFNTPYTYKAFQDPVDHGTGLFVNFTASF